MRRSYLSITASFLALTMSINCLQLTSSYGLVITAYEDRLRHLFRRDVLSPTESTLPLNTTLSDQATTSNDDNVNTTTSTLSGENTTTTLLSLLQSTATATITEIASTTNATIKPNMASTATPAYILQSSPAESSSTAVLSAETATSSSSLNLSTSTATPVTSTTRDSNDSVSNMTTIPLPTPTTSTAAFQSPISTSLSATESTTLASSTSTSTATTTTAAIQWPSSTLVSIGVTSTVETATSSTSATTTTITPLISPLTTTTPASSSTAVSSNLSTITNSSTTPLAATTTKTTTNATDNRTSTAATVAAGGANGTVTDVTTGFSVNVTSTVKPTTVGSVNDSTLVDRASNVTTNGDYNNTRTRSSVVFSTGTTVTSGERTTTAVTDSTSTASTVAHTSLTTTIAAITTSAKQQITAENTTTSSNVLISSSTTAPTTLPSTSANGTTSTTTTTTPVPTTLVTSVPTLETHRFNSSSTSTTTTVGTPSEQQSQALSTTTTTSTATTTTTTTTTAAAATTTPTSSSPSSEAESLSTSPNNDTLFATTSSRTLLLTTSTTESSPVNYMLAIYIAVPAAGTLILICGIAGIVVCALRCRKNNKNKHKRLETTTSNESYAMHRRGAGNVYGNGVLRSRSEMSLSSMSTKPDESGYDVIDLAAVCDVGFGTRAGSALGGDGDRLTHRPRLPVDLRSAAPSVAGSDRRSGINVAGMVERRSSADDMRDLTVSLLELKHRIEEYVQTGVHLERRPIPLSNSIISSQYQLISAISDVSSRISDAISRYQLQTNLPESSKPLPQTQTAWNVPPDLVAPAFLVEHLMTLRPRIDRLVRLLARSVRAQPNQLNGTSENGGQSRDPLSSLQQQPPPGTVEVSTLTTVLANVGASVTMAIESIAEICRDDQYILLPPSTGRSGARTPRTSIGYERVRRPPASRNGGRPYRIRVPTDRCLDTDRDVFHSDPINQLKSLIGELAVVRCRLQTLSELDPEQSIDDVGGDIWWQAGLVSSLDKLTDYLVDLVKYDDAASATDNSSNVTSHGSLRVTGANFDQLLSEKLAAFQIAAERVILTSSFGRRPPWDLDTWQMVLNLLRATLDVSRVPRRPHQPDTIRSLRRHYSQHPNLIDFVRENRAATTSNSGGSVISSTGPSSNMVRVSNEPDIGRHTSPQGQTPSVATAGSSSRSWLVSGNGSRNSRSTNAAGSSRSRFSGAHGGVMPSSSASQSSQSYRQPEISRLFEMNPAASSVRSVSRPGSEMTFVVSETDTAEMPDLDFLDDIEDLPATEQTDAGEDDVESLFEVVVDRTSPESLLDNIFNLYDQTPIDQLRRQVKVTFHNELGVDAGALSREFFFLIFEALASGRTVRSRSAFHGARGHLLPSIDHVLTESRVFWFVGVLLVQSVQRGCHGLPGLCDAVRHFLAAGARISTIGRSLSLVTMEDVADLELRAILTKMQNNKDLSDSEQSVQERWLDEAKFTRPLNSSTMREAVQRIICHYIFDSRMVQLQAIAEGMAEMGYQVGEEQEEVINNMFPRDSKLTVIDFMNGIVFEDGVDDRDDQQSSMSAGTETGSDSGGSRMGTASRCSRADIQRTMQYFRRYIDDVYNGKIGKLKLEDILQFINGAPYFSSMSAATVRFDSTSSMPHAHACSSEIVLPARHRSYRGFRMALTNAFEYGALGFGNA